MTDLIEVRKLRKEYKQLVAVDDISFGIPAGICFGLLGPNGAGKSTTIEMIEGIKEPTSGEILYKGKPRDKRFAERCGIQFQSTALQDFLSGREVLELFSTFYKRCLPLADLIERCDLGEFLDRPANKLSGGQKQRLLLALALINDPEIVFLDEPTTGLDPQSRRRFWSLINDIKKQGKTVVLTTHYMDEAESLCDDLIIVDHGRIIDRGSPQALLGKHLPHKQICLSETGLSADGISGDMIEHRDQTVISSTSIEQTIRELMTKGLDLSTLQVRSPTLEDLFIKLTGHALRD